MRLISIIIIALIFSKDAFCQCNYKVSLEPPQIKLSKLDSMILNSVGWSRLDSIRVFFDFHFGDSITILLNESKIESAYVAYNKNVFVTHDLTIPKPSKASKIILTLIVNSNSECKINIELNRDYNTIYIFRSTLTDFRIYYQKGLEVRTGDHSWKY